MLSRVTRIRGIPNNFRRFSSIDRFKLDSPSVKSYPKKPSDVKVVLLENIHPLGIQAFKDAGFNVESRKEALSGQELIDVAGDAVRRFI